MSHHVDLAVLGAGPGGYVAAVRAAQLGLSVTLVEEKFWGGVCLNIGCVPAKTLLRNAEIARLISHEAAAFGIVGEARLDYGAAVQRSRAVSEGRVKGVHYLMRKNGIREVSGRGAFRDTRTLEVTRSDGGTETVTFENVIIATGSTVRGLPGVPLSDNVVTYETLILEPSLPTSIVVVGAGAIGMEFAYVMSSFGVRVTVLEYLDRVLPNEDEDISTEVEKQFASMGVTILTGSEVTSVTDDGRLVALNYRDSSGAEHELEAEKVLVSVGFAANVSGYGLEKTGVRLTDRGAIQVDDHLRTSVPGIYAIGDVTAKLQLAHVAEAQGIVAAEAIAGVPTEPLGDYRMMPRATFCQPQVASFGLTERQARETGRDITVSTFPMVANAKAHALGDARGFVKLIADAEHGELVGGHLIGHDVSELLPELTLAQRFELTAEDLIRNVHTHPTLSEGLQEAFHGLAGHMINL